VTTVPDVASVLRRMRRAPAPSDHFDGKRFFNPGVDTDKRLADFIRWHRSGNRHPWPDRVENRHYPPPGAVGDATVTYIGQATLLLRSAGLNILTDPVFAERIGPFPRIGGPRRVRAPGLPIAALPPIHAVLLSHNHYDHMDLPSLHRLRDRDDPLILTGLGNRAYLRRHGLARCVELDWWDAAPLPVAAGATGTAIATFVPAQHWSGRWAVDRRRTLWGGFVVEMPDGRRIYFAGDTGYAPAHFAAIRERLGPPDLALLPIGAYEPRWFMKPQHMNPDDAARAHLDLAARISVGIHFGTFQLTDEAIDAPAADLRAALTRHGIPESRFVVPGFGETLPIPARDA
jgi:L-ascorbate metabolism protein UlaG (beta-lactamase superfamily)